MPCHESQELRRTVSYFKFLCHNLSFRIVVLAVTYRSCLIVNILNILPHIAKKKLYLSKDTKNV